MMYCPVHRTTKPHDMCVYALWPIIFKCRYCNIASDEWWAYYAHESAHPQYEQPSRSGGC